MKSDPSPAKRHISEVDEAEDEKDSELHKRRKEDGPHVHSKGLNSCLELEFPPTSLGGSSPSPPPFQYPFQLISFSYTPTRELEFTDSALRYYAIPPHGADLSFRYDSWIKRPEERGRLDGLLEACLHERVFPETRRANVISWRGVMTKILTAPYEDRDGWELNVMNVADALYFEEHTTEGKLKEKESMTPRNRLQTYYGYAFESFATSATPSTSDDTSRLPNGWSGDVNTNVQWCSVVKTKLGKMRLLVGGEVDCVKGMSCNKKYTGQPNTFVELKTSMTIRGQTDEARFEKKLLKFYFQSFLLGVPEIVVGFRTPSGRIADLQTFKTIELPRLVRGKKDAWDPNICLSWGDRFLTFLKTSIDELRDQEPNETPIQEGISDAGAHVWRVSFKPGKGVDVRLLDDAGVQEVQNGEDRVGFLPTSYFRKVSKSTK
ncbi:RAI1-domain-containing protein [Schizopora paradoxa]|uniref:Decapping nuclease n=1 Tax=Schizopora paradoxa TaxID=27342 RepID=A0A0H2RHP8_9AGAM|nr:RAI1-domain-containing protein [Schizopora paradoxa]